MSQPPYSNYFNQQNTQQQQYPQNPQYQQQQPFMQQQQPFMSQTTYPQQQFPGMIQKQPHWFDQMCEALTSQQSIHEAGSLERPPMLTPGNYVQWASRFLRFIELRKPNGKHLKHVILNGPYPWPSNTVPGDPNITPPRPTVTTPVAEHLLTPEQTQMVEADQLAMEYICLGIPNPIFRSIDSQKTAHAMWENIHLLMEGTELNKEDMESKLYHVYDTFTISPGESLESYYHRFTDIINDLERNNVKMPKIAINTKFLNSLGPDWEKYVTFVRQSKNLHDAKHGLLFDYLKHHEKEVAKDRAMHAMLQPSTPQNSLALMAQSNQHPMSYNAFTQPQQSFANPQPIPSNQPIQQQPTPSQMTPYNNQDTMYYAQATESDDDAFQELTDGFTMIAKAFG